MANKIVEDIEDLWKNELKDGEKRVTKKDIIIKKKKNCCSTEGKSKENCCGGKGGNACKCATGCSSEGQIGRAHV